MLLVVGLVALASVLFAKRKSLEAATVGFLQRGKRSVRVLRAVNVPAGGLVR